MTAKVHVCHVSTLTCWGGVERMLLDFLEHPGSDRLSYSIICTSSIPEVADSFRRLGLPVFQPERSFHYDPRAIWQMARWMRAQRIQVVHSYNVVGNAWGNMAAFLARVPVCIGGEHGTVWSARPPKSWLNHWAYHRANIVTVNSRACKTMVCNKYKVSPEKVRIVYNTSPPLPKVDTVQIRSKLGLGSEIVVGSVGRLAPQKGFKTLVDAAKQVLKTRSNVKFVLVGGGIQEKALKDYVQISGLSDRFILTGWRKDARELLQVFDIFVSTSIYEPFGNVLVEAAMASKPVIAPRVDGIPEVVVDDLTGRLLTPSVPAEGWGSGTQSSLPKQVLIDGKPSAPLALDAQKLADAILNFVDNAGLREKYGGAGRARALDMFSIERYKRQLEELYIETLSG
ncbi:MAG: glycosyltransferase [Chloroflexi bacterium]|nr:glycosyltransferase [Chloroflexota bacterium]